ncbi:MAG: helix-hairpin-helix domain-containing protein [Deltaproteobacteria bacterium]|nr:helix-hairpin-helix domain-containing protein [Deltaproteobacteria bacterium]
MNLAKRQIYGAIGIVLVAVFMYAARDVYQYTYASGRAAACCEYEKSGIVVELAGDENYGGIYFLSQRATVHDLFRKAGLDDIAGFKNIDLDRVLHSGDMIVCDRTRYLVTLGDVAASVRLAFGMPVDLNKATVKELMLIPGIGRKTAAKIIRFRKEKKRFSEVDTLKRIIREKRYNRIKDYLYVGFLPLDREKLW